MSSKRTSKDTLNKLKINSSKKEEDKKDDGGDSNFRDGFNMLFDLEKNKESRIDKIKIDQNDEGSDQNSLKTLSVAKDEKGKSKEIISDYRMFRHDSNIISKEILDKEKEDEKSTSNVVLQASDGQAIVKPSNFSSKKNNSKFQR